MDRFHRPALVHRHVHDHRALLHGGHHLLGDQHRGQGAGDEHRPDQEVGPAQHLADVEAVGHQGDDAAVEEIVHRAQAVEVDVEDRDVRAQAQRDARRVDPHRARAQHHDVAGGHPGHAGQQDAAAAARLGEEERALLHRQAAGHLAHRGEQGQRAVGALHRLVGDRDDARGLERPRQLGRGGQVQVGEEELARAHARVLLRQRLLHLEDQLGLAPHLLDRRERRSLARVLLVADAAAEPGAALDDHAVLALDEGAGAGRGQRHALLAGLDLARHPDDHAARPPRAPRLTAAGSATASRSGR